MGKIGVVAMSEAPDGFPFEPGDKIAARVLGPTGDELWFGGTLDSVHRHGFVMSSPTQDGIVMWLPWSIPVRTALTSEFEEQQS